MMAETEGEYPAVVVAQPTGEMSPEKVEVSLINEPSNAEAVAGTTTAMSLEPNNNSLVAEAYYYEEPVAVQQEEPQQNDNNKKSSKKKARGSVRHIELMEWLPTLPQLFAYMGFTQLLIMFWVFVGVCAKQHGTTWNIIMMWITVLLTTAIFFVYNLMLAKQRPIRSLTATIFAFIAHLFMFQYPINVSYRTGITYAEWAILVVFRCLIILLVVGLYCLAYKEDLRSGPHEEEEGDVYSNGTAQ